MGIGSKNIPMQTFLLFLVEIKQQVFKTRSYGPPAIQKLLSNSAHYGRCRPAQYPNPTRQIYAFLHSIFKQNFFQKCLEPDIFCKRNLRRFYCFGPKSSNFLKTRAYGPPAIQSSAHCLFFSINGPKQNAR